MINKSNIRYGNLIKKYENSDFAYTNPGFRFFGENGPANFGSAEILDLSIFKNRTIMIVNNHSDTGFTVKIDLTTKASGLMLDNILGTVIEDTVAAGQNKLYYPKNFPELDIPSPGLVVGLQRLEEPIETGLGVDIYFLGGL